VNARSPKPLRGARSGDHAKVAGVVAYYPYCFADTKFSVPTKIFIGEKDDWTPAPRCEAIVDRKNVEITVYPKALHAFAESGAEHTYLGHRMGEDRAATADAQQHALQLIQAQSK
jgi:dienelactone hydrolase